MKQLCFTPVAHLGINCKYMLQVAGRATGGMLLVLRAVVKGQRFQRSKDIMALVTPHVD